MDPILTIAATAAREAGALLRRRSRRLDLLKLNRKKEGIVSDADTDAESLIIKIITKTYPDHGFFAEESGVHGDQSRCWAIDPLDGTTNFVRGMPHYCVSVAFCEDGAPRAGVIYDVCRDDLFSAARGGGAYLNDRRIRVADSTQFSNALLLSSAQIGGGARGWPLLKTLQRKSAGVRRGGATALDFAHTAAGAAGALFGANARYWDIAAGLLILREAGGFACELDADSEFAFGRRTGFFAAGAPKIFTEVIRVARAASAAGAAGVASADAALQ